MEEDKTFKVDCPYCGATNTYHLNSIKTSYCFKGFRIRKQHSVECHFCKKRLFITTNIKKDLV